MTASSSEPLTKPSSSAKKTKKGTSPSQVISMMLMVLVVLVVYWEEMGLESMFADDDDPGSLTLQTKGEWKDWGAWNKETVLLPDDSDKKECTTWTTYTSVVDKSKKAQICVAEEGTSVQNPKDCLLQTRQWDPRADKQYYLEIGSGTGTCVVEMLLSTHALVVVVEPYPENLFLLTSTLLKNPLWLPRIQVLPLALGKQASDSVALQGSFQEARIASDDTGSIRMERLDSILQPGGVQLVGLNVNGYECLVLDGGLPFFKKVPSMTFPVLPQQLQHCTSELLLAKVAALFRTEAKWYRDTGRLRALPKQDENKSYMAVVKRHVKKKTKTKKRQ